MLVELKWDKSAQTALQQIKDKQYPQVLAGYQGKVLLIGISYDKKNKVHACEMETWEMVW